MLAYKYIYIYKFSLSNYISNYSLINYNYKLLNIKHCKCLYKKLLFVYYPIDPIVMHICSLLRSYNV